MKLYAVKKGRQTGIFNTWNECKLQVDGYKGAQYKSFSTISDAEEYMSYSPPIIIKNKNSYLKIWTDGSCIDNGCELSIAGIGVFFNKDDSRNLSERFSLPRPTNQRSELHAIRRALDQVPNNIDVEIISDSKYSIQCVTEWIHSWKKNNWNKNTVVNRDLIEDLHNKITSRSGDTIFSHVYSHSGIYGNEDADQLAALGCSKDLQ
jgi:ribonuclease HI